MKKKNHSLTEVSDELDAQAILSQTRVHPVLSRRAPERSGFKTSSKVKSLLPLRMEPQSVITQPVTYWSIYSEGFDEGP
jgi:hypothetical protein